MIKVQNEEGLVRDPHSKAILVTDKDALLSHRKKRMLMEEFNINRQEVKDLKQEVSEIKTLLNQLLEKIG